MKKTLALMLALLLALCCASALAEEETPEYLPYTHPVLGYTLEYPAQWLVVDTETLPVLMKLLTEGDMEGMDPAVLENLGPQITATNMTVFMDVNNGANVTIGGQDLGMEVTNDLFMSFLMPSLRTQYEAMFDEIEFYDEGFLYQAGDKEYCALSMTYVVNGGPLNAIQFYLLDGTAMYVIGYTVSANIDEVTDAIYQAHVTELLSSFTLAE